MRAAYVDTSFLIAILFGEPAGRDAVARLAEFDEVFSGNLLEAELRSVCAREQVALPEEVRASISWVLPDHALSDEIRVVLDAGDVRGADLWHLATALYLAADVSAIAALATSYTARPAASVHDPCDLRPGGKEVGNARWSGPRTVFGSRRRT